MLHRIGEVGASAVAGSVAACVAALWVLTGFVTGFPTWWAMVLYSATSITTFVMVFVIHHTQTRQTAAMQRKLDEIVRAAGLADNNVIAIEEASDDDLHELATTALSDRDGSPMDHS